MSSNGWVMYDTAEECADAAAPVFLANNWQWGSDGSEDLYVPSRDDIYATLRDLERLAKQQQVYQQTASGRLAYINGRFGHQNSEASE